MPCLPPGRTCRRWQADVHSAAGSSSGSPRWRIPQRKHSCFLVSTGHSRPTLAQSHHRAAVSLVPACRLTHSPPGWPLKGGSASLKVRQMLWRDLVKDKKLKTIAVSLHVGKVTEERRGNQEGFSCRPSEFLPCVKEVNRSHGPRAWHSDKKDTESRSTTPRGSL